MDKKISVSNYLLNKDLLKVINYITFENKVVVVDSILKELCFNNNGLYTLDSVMLNRVKTQIYIEQYTNLDLNIENEEGLNGYDLLVRTNELDNLINTFRNEYNIIENILELRLSDYLRDKSSIKGFLHYKSERIINFIIDKVNNLNENLDKKEIEKI